MPKKIIAIYACVILLFSGCEAVKELGNTYNMVNCTYDYNSVGNLRIGGMDLSRGVNWTMLPKVTALLTGFQQSVPLDFTLNLDVNNPGTHTAAMHGLEYILTIDDIQFTTGSVNQSLTIPAGGKQVLPLTIGLDLATLLKSDAGSTVLNTTKNFIGIGDTASKVSLKIRPTFLINGTPIKLPTYIPVNFSFGGK